jgi:hypothetical protein
MDGESHCTIDYKCSFKHESFETVKIYNEDGKKSKICPVFSGEHGIEGLLYVESRFRTIASRFEFDGPKYFEGFEEILQGTALTAWEMLADDVVENERNMERFEELLVSYYVDFCDVRARDTMYDYLKNKCKKPVGDEPRNHVRRMEVLYLYSSKLPGMEALMTDDQIKRAIFKTFPETWRKQYMRSAKNLEEDSMQEIVTFMQNEKAYADADKKINTNNGDKKRSKNENESNQNHMKKKFKGGRGGGQGKVKPGDPCPHHFGHSWNECFDNPRGSQFRPRGGGGRGRGGGRDGRGGRGNYGGYPGRGGFGGGGRGNDYQGRGGRGGNPVAGQNYHNNNNNYHYENQHHDQNRGQGRGNEANTQGQANAGNRNQHEQHHYDAVDYEAWN